MRLFIAVQLSDEMKNAVISAQNTLRKNKVSGHFTDVQKLHLTLAFIGEYGNTARKSILIVKIFNKI